MADDLPALLEVAEAAARDAGTTIVREQSGARSSVETKSSPTDLVTSTDRRAEAIIVGWIEREFPHDSIVAEEGASRRGSSGRRWIIDPLDGTANFVRGWRMSTVSIGVTVDDGFTVGVVYDPFQDEMFTGTDGGGAFLNGYRLQLNPSPVKLEHAYVGVNGGHDFSTRALNAEILRLMQLQGAGLRSIGCVSLSLCYVAAGRYEAYSSIGARIWDIAAGTVIAREAGGLVQGFEPGSEPNPERTLAARPELLEPLRSVVLRAASLVNSGGSEAGSGRERR
jgi:myo-inositol-1(or 4)-monophosphatase